MRPRHATVVTASQQALAALKVQAKASTSRERGGILIGYRLADAVHIHDALVVPDATAARTRYLRRHREGQRVLDDWLELSDDATVGYVGEWHTHPEPAPPSPTDLTAARFMAIKNSRPVVLVVAALASNKRDVDLHAVVTHPTTLARRLTGAISVASVREHP